VSELETLRNLLANPRGRCRVGRAAESKRGSEEYENEDGGGDGDVRESPAPDAQRPGIVGRSCDLSQQVLPQLPLPDGRELAKRRRLGSVGHG
jgi:hypothetical protein